MLGRKGSFIVLVSQKSLIPGRINLVIVDTASQKKTTKQLQNIYNFNTKISARVRHHSCSAQFYCGFLLIGHNFSEKSIWEGGKNQQNLAYWRAPS